MAITPTPAMIAREQLYELHKQMTDPTDQAPVWARLQLALLAALVEIADRLDAIEKALNSGVIGGGRMDG